MMDEPVGGLNPDEINGLMDLVRRLMASGITIMLIEHVMKVVVRATTRVIVLHHGELIADDPPQTVMRDPRVIDAYLGAKFAARYGAAPP